MASKDVFSITKYGQYSFNTIQPVAGKLDTISNTKFCTYFSQVSLDNNCAIE